MMPTDVKLFRGVLRTRQQRMERDINKKRKNEIEWFVERSELESRNGKSLQVECGGTRIYCRTCAGRIE